LLGAAGAAAPAVRFYALARSATAVEAGGPLPQSRRSPALARRPAVVIAKGDNGAHPRRRQHSQSALQLDIRAGTAGQKLEQALADIKPEAVYFTERDGMRGCTVIVDRSDASGLPAIAASTRP
jgi:hypothetical protein